MIAVPLIVLLLIGLLIFRIAANRETNEFDGMRFNEMLDHSLADQEGARISMAVIKGETMEFLVYGNNSEAQRMQLRDYEIGGLTKTLTASLLCNAQEEGKLSLDDPIDQYLELKERPYYPSLRRIITHTAGYKDEYFAAPMLGNRIGGKNPLTGIDGESLQKRVGRIKLSEEDDGFLDSDFGIAVIGQVLESIYGTPFPKLLEDYAAKDLGLAATRFTYSKADPKWQETDAYLAADGLTSNIEDMAKYLKQQMDGEPEEMAQAKRIQVHVDGNSKETAALGIRIDAVTAGWMADFEKNIIWYSGETENSHVFLGYDMESLYGVVILSSLTEERIPTTQMGAQKLKEMMA